eukprot:CAMPEP_0202712330 /NCGR_PEP_ID=MMETSP1385-20130828/37948_1 /ASSEMBLY_ACC=CAM_ASM_000861 /TAXON_ID=933848 /ORGANISM="Elphidium margaritaceum" /LENGTH=422 /DNA_ID=CAMNT_0049372333 /DNA_START=54 /DNA_END=1322 /DNA_ORIENTATION=+
MHAKKTQLLQQNIDDPLDSTRVFNAEHGDQIPLVLVPQGRSCLSCYYHIPSGVNTIVHICGSDGYPDGLAPPGIQMCKPWYNHVAYMVTQQSCTYNAPVKSCPTKDNVMVDCELTLVFAIGPNPADVKKFVYNLGALKFNEFLAAECEEAIRQLIRVTPLSDVYELRGSSSVHVQNVLKVLDEKFKEFGVTFSKAAITDVVLNNELRKILQGTTEFRTKIRELDKEHEHNMKLITYDFQRNLSEKERLYDRRLQDIEADINVALVNRKKEVVNAESRREVAVTKQQETAAVNKKRAESELNVAQAKAEQENAKLLAVATSNAESARIKVDKETEVAIFESEQLIKVAENKATALKTEAKAEGDAAESLKVIREHNLEMAKLEVQESIAKRAKIVISGDQGDALINSILDKELLTSQISLNYK